MCNHHHRDVLLTTVMPRERSCGLILVISNKVSPIKSMDLNIKLLLRVSSIHQSTKSLSLLTFRLIHQTNGSIQERMIPMVANKNKLGNSHSDSQDMAMILLLLQRLSKPT